jgi:C1A family cysteine protease
MRKLKYGWKPDLPDYRDIYFTRVEGFRDIPKIDLAPLFQPIIDQGELGSCTACAITDAFEFEVRKSRPESAEELSKLFLYYLERFLEGTVKEDSGAMIRTGMKVLAHYGVCSESLWDYDISKFAVKPPKRCFENALAHKVLVYLRVNQNLTDIRACLAAKYPITFGISLYESFHSEDVWRTGIVPMPSGNDSSLGGHAILLVGYDDRKRLFKFRNSWSEEWGDKGYGYLPYAYVTNGDLATDFWTIRQV